MINKRELISLTLLSVANIQLVSAMQTNVTVTDSQASLKLQGRFDYKAHREFREGADKLLAQATGRRITVDLQDVSYLDDSALGMLLMLRDKAKALSREVELQIGSNRSVRNILEQANFIKLFQLR